MNTNNHTNSHTNSHTNDHSNKESWSPYPLDSRIYIIFSIISLMLLFYSIWEMKPIVVGINDFLGLVSHLTLAYWLGFVTIIIFSIRLYLDKVREKYVYLTYLVVIGLYFFAVPIFAEDNARFPWSYYPVGEVKTVLDTQKIDIASKYPVLSYRSWPAIHFISASILYLTNVKIENLIKYMPIFWIFFTIFTMFSIGKRLKFSINQSFILTILMISSFWSFHYYYGPQSLAYLLYLSLFLLVIGFNKYIKGIIITLLIFTVLVMSHMLTSIALIYSSISTSKLLAYKNRTKFIILLLIIFVAWYVYVAPSMFKIGAREFITQAMKAEIFSFINTGKYEEGTFLTRQITHYARLSYLGIYAILMAISALYMIGKVKEENKNLIKICLYWLIGILALFMFKYGESEIDDRVYILSLVPMTLILVSSFNNKILILITILFVSLHIPAHYGSESYDQASTTELKGAEFFAINIPYNEDRYSYYYAAYIRFYEPKKIFMRWSSFTGVNKPDISKLDKAKYIIDSDKSNNFMIYAHGFDPTQEWIRVNQYNLNMFYDNGHFKIYKK